MRPYGGLKVLIDRSALVGQSQLGDHAIMNEGSKLMDSQHTTFDTMALSGEEEVHQSVPIMDRRVSMPPRRRTPINWPEAIKGYARSYIPPLVHWIPKYSPKNIVADLLAGITVGVMVIPQGLSFALIANLDPVYGLYVAMISSFVYFLLGSSNYLIVGPTAVLSLIVGGFTKQGGSPEMFLRDALLLSFLSGIILMILSFLRLGFVTNLLSKPISVGFTAGAAILITFSQLKNIFGIPMETPETIIVLFKEIVHLAKNHTKVNGWAILFFVLSFAYILVLKNIKYTKMIPGPLFALIMGTLAAYGFDMPNRVGLNVVGFVPKGFPKFTVPVTSFDDVLRALPYSFVVAFLGFVEAFTIAKPLALKEGSDIQADQELFALGVSNFLGSFLSSFPTAGSFTRTAVNYSSGARSPFSGLVSAFIVMISLLFLTPYLKFLPYCILASVVMSGVINLFDFHDMKYIWKTKKRDFFVMVASFALTLLLGVDVGVLSAIAIHILLLVVGTIRMRVEELVDAGDGVFVHVLDDPFSQQIPGIILAKVTDSLVYLNIESFMKQVEVLLKQHGSLMPKSKKQSTQAQPETPEPPNNTLASVAEILGQTQDGNGAEAHEAALMNDEEDPSSEGLLAVPVIDPAHPGRMEEEIIDGEAVPLTDAEEPPILLNDEPSSLANGTSSNEEKDPAYRYPNAVVFDFSMVNNVDSSSMMRLEELRKILAQEGYSMHFAHVHSSVLNIMYRGEFLNELGNNGLFLSLGEALNFLTRSKNKRSITFV